MVLLLDGSVELDEPRLELRRDGEVVPLEPQAFDVLVHLVRHRDRVVTKQELMDAVWGGRFVTEAAVTSRIKQVRRALGDDGRNQRLVRTLHGRGYRFSGSVREVLAAPGGPQPPVAPPSGAATGRSAPVRYTTSDGLHIAYQVTGGGERDIVLIAGFVSHLDLDWDDPRHARFLDRLGTMGRLVRFDKRGTGMSDRPAGLPSLETRVHDVLAVMDAAGSGRAVLLGYSEGGPMALLMAATHPERVSALVLYGGYAKRTRAPDYPWGQSAEERAAYTDDLVRRWDWEADLRLRVPSGDDAMARWWTRRMTAAATPTTVRALMDMNAAVDVRGVLGSVTVPTLVVHRTGDPLFAVEEARYLADRIPGAELVLLDGSDHFVAGDPDQILDAVEPFVAGTPAPAAAPQRSLAAVTAVAGPDDAAVVALLVAAGGRERPTTDGHRVVLFDGPATAVRAGTAALRHHPRCAVGLSVADVPLSGPVGGPTVTAAGGLAARAGAGRLRLSGTAVSLLADAGIPLDPVQGDPTERVVAT